MQSCSEVTHREILLLYLFSYQSISFVISPLSVTKSSVRLDTGPASHMEAVLILLNLGASFNTRQFVLALFVCVCMCQLFIPQSEA